MTREARNLISHQFQLRRRRQHRAAIFYEHGMRLHLEVWVQSRGKLDRGSLSLAWHHLFGVCVCVCVCVCVYLSIYTRARARAHTHTHTQRDSRDIGRCKHTHKHIHTHNRGLTRYLVAFRWPLVTTSTTSPRRTIKRSVPHRRLHVSPCTFCT